MAFTSVSGIPALSVDELRDLTDKQLRMIAGAAELTRTIMGMSYSEYQERILAECRRRAQNEGDALRQSMQETRGREMIREQARLEQGYADARMAAELMAQEEADARMAARLAEE